MGIYGLLSYCRTITNPADMTVRSLRIGIDAFGLVYLFKERTAELEEYIHSLLRLDHTLIFILDKKANKEKQKTIQMRQEKREVANKKVKELTELIQSPSFETLDEKIKEKTKGELLKKKKASWHFNNAHKKWFLGFLKTLQEEGKSVEIISAQEEADDDLAKGNFDRVISADSDLLLLGCKILWIPLGNHIKHNEIIGETFTNYIGLNKEQLYELSYLVGCDVQVRKIVPIDVAVSWLRFYGSLEILVKKFPHKLKQSDLDEYKRLKETVWIY